MDELVTINLIDFQSDEAYNTDSTPSGCILNQSSILFQYLTDKFRKASTKTFSLNFEKVDSIIGNELMFYSQICHKYNVLMVGESKALVFYDLETRRKLFTHEFNHYFCYFLVVGDDLFISNGNLEIAKYDFGKIMKRDTNCLIWSCKGFRYLWGFSYWNGMIYACDYSAGLKCVDPVNGLIVSNIELPQLSNPADIMFITFTQYNEMVVCGSGYVEIFTLQNNTWISKKKITEITDFETGIFSVCYEKASDRIFVTDSSSILVLDRVLNKVKLFNIEGIFGEGSGLYGINIDEMTGYCYICKSFEIIVNK